MLPRWRSGKKKSAHRCRGSGFNSWIGQILWRRKRKPTQVFLPENSHEQRSVVGFGSQGHKESDMIEHLSTRTHTHPHTTHTHTHTHTHLYKYTEFPSSSVVKNTSVSAGDTRDAGLTPGSGRSPGEVNGNPLSYSCLENPWTEELGGLQSLGPQESRTCRSD